MKRLRLLHLTHSLRPESGGTATAVLESARSQRDAGNEVEIVSLQRSSSPAPSDIKTHVVGEISGGYGYNRELGPWLESQALHHDLLVIHGLWQYHGLAAWRHWNRRAGGRYVVFTHGMLDPWFNRENRLKQLKKQPYWWLIERSVLRDASAVCFTCEEERRLASRSFGGYRAREEVVGLGLAADEETGHTGSAAFTRAFPALESSPFLLFLGRIHPKKGLENTITAYAQTYQNQDSPPPLVIAGPCSEHYYAEKLKRQADQLGLKQLDYTAGESPPTSAQLASAPQLIWLPMIEGEIKQGALTSCEVLVLFSHQENFGLVVAEAAAAARPVLLTKSVNIWREIFEAKAGWATEDTLPDIRESFSRWRVTPSDVRIEMGARARQCYLQNFTATAATNRFLEVARKSIQENHAV